MIAQVFYNCRILKGGRLLTGELWVLNGRIVAPSEGRAVEYTARDCRNNIIAPGFIDIQFNGGYGKDFTAATDLQDALATCSRMLPATGVTSYCPTIITSDPAEYARRLPLISYTPGNGKRGATVLGIHCEGPFISMQKRGCHPPNLVRTLTNGNVAKQISDTYGNDLSNVVMLTLAPEQPGAMQAIRELSSQGIVVSMGHSEATFARGEEGMTAGASCLTHLFSAMNAFGHREPSLPGLICSESYVGDHNKKLLNQIKSTRRRSEEQIATNLASPVSRIRSQDSVASSHYCPNQLFYGLIADCVHTHPSSLRVAYRLNRKGLCLITDAMAALGLPDGIYNLGETEVEVGGKPRRAIKKGTDTLAGVVANLAECVRNFARETDCGLPFALTAASYTPADALGISSIKGHLEPGADADFIMIDDDVNILETWISGELAYVGTREKGVPENLSIDDNAVVHAWPMRERSPMAAS